MTDITLCTFDRTTEADYLALADCIRCARPEYPQTAGDLKDQDQVYEDSGKPWGRIWAVHRQQGKIGYAEFSSAIWQPGDGKFFVNVIVHPDFLGTGVGKVLYNAIWADLEKHNPTYVKTELREDWSRAVQFYQDRGWKEIVRWYESRLDIPSFDFKLYAKEYDLPLTQGVDIVSWRSLLQTDPDADQKMWTSVMEMSADVPSDTPFEPMPFDEFQRVIMSRPNLDPDGFFVAVDTESRDYVGISHIWRRPADNNLDTGLTAVKRTYRRRGIALAMKLRILQWAKNQGVQSLRTGNDATNRAMLAINERLGFEKVPAWIELLWKPS